MGDDRSQTSDYGREPLADSRQQNCATARSRLGTRQAVFTLTQNILGSGVLALPFAFKDAGFAGVLALISMIYLMTFFSMGALVMLAGRLNEFSFTGLAGRTGGRLSAIVVEIWVLGYGLGICISYPILLGDFLSKLLKDFGAGAWCSERLCMIVSICCVCWPLSCSPSLGALSKLSTLGVVFISLTGVFVAARYADGTYVSKGRGGGCKILNFEDFGECFPILVGAFGAHFNIPALYREVCGATPPSSSESTLDHPGDYPDFSRMMRIVAYSLTLSAAVYVFIGAVVYATFKSSTASDFTENYRSDDQLIAAARSALAFSICVSFPLVLISSRRSLQNLLQCCGPNSRCDGSGARILLTSGLSIFILVVALASRHLENVLAYNGALFGTPVCYIIPGVMYLRLPRAVQRPFWRHANIFCALMGIVLGIFGVVTVSRGPSH